MTHPFEDLSVYFEDNIGMDQKQMYVDWIRLAQWYALVNEETNLLVPQNGRKSAPSEVPASRSSEYVQRLLTTALDTTLIQHNINSHLLLDLP